jgi:hypothetical protein
MGATENRQAIDFAHTVLFSVIYDQSFSHFLDADNRISARFVRSQQHSLSYFSPDP